MAQTTTSTGRDSITSTDPGTAIFFGAGLVAVIVNVILAMLLRIFATGKGASTTTSLSATTTWTGITAIIYLVALSIGLRHLLRIAVIDSYVKRKLLPSNARSIYWLILIGTILGTVSFTVSIAGATWYLLVLFPYLAICVFLGFTLVYRVKRFSKDDQKDYLLTMFTDVATGLAILEIYQVLSGRQTDLGIDFAFILLVGIIFFGMECSRVYWAPCRERIRIIWKLLSR